MLLSFFGENDSQYTFLTFVVLDEGRGGKAGWIDASLCGGFPPGLSLFTLIWRTCFGGVLKDVDVAGWMMDVG